MTESSIPVAFDEMYNPPRPVVYIQLRGDSEDDVQELMRPLSPVRSSFHVFVRVEGLEHAYPMVANVTLSQLADLTEILELDNGYLRVDNGGRGGGPMATLMDVVNVIGYVTTAVAGGQLVERAYNAMRYGKQQNAASDWLRGGRSDVLDPLRTFVRSANSWAEGEFSHRFALSAEQSYQLLRAAGYEYDDRDGLWWRDSNSHAPEE
jgi:hypothetical protein